MSENNDRTIEAIEKRVYERMWDSYVYPWDRQSDVFRERFRAAIAAELQPVRRVRDEDGDEWVVISGKEYRQSHITLNQYGPLTELPPAYVGRATLPVKQIAAELWAAFQNIFLCGADGHYHDYGTSEGRERWQSAISRLMGGAAERPLPEIVEVPQELDAESHLKAARDLLRERMKDYADKGNYERVRDHADCLCKLAEVVEHGVVKDHQLPQ